MPIGAAIGSAVVGAGASIIGANTAANAQKSAASSATNAQLQMFGITQQDLAPFISAGTAAVPGEQQTQGTLNKLLSPNGGIDMSTLESLPGYQFNLTQGLKAVQNSAAARGLGTSGAALKGAASYASGLADSTYGTYVNQLLGQETAQQGQEAIGSNAAAGVASNATATGQGVASNTIGAGNASAAAANASGSAVNNAAGNLAQTALLNKLLGTSSGMYTTPTVAQGALY